jgi:peptide/nickel transport system substrate-binding protein
VWNEPEGALDGGNERRGSMKARWRGIALMTMIAVVVGTLVGSALAQDTGAKPKKDKVVFTWGATTDPSSLNPMSGYLATDFYFWTAGYHLLINFDDQLGAVPGLATKVETSDDNMTFTYTIRDDQTWSDGMPLTADDVAFTLNLYKGNHAYLPQGYLTLIDGDVVATDSTHITFHTTQPTGLYSGKVPYMYDYILPEHIFKDIEKPKQFENVPSVGSGPFTIAEYKVGEYVRMIRNPYWTGATPHVDEIVYQIFKNEDALSQALKAGEVDFGYFTSANIYNSLQGQPNIGTLNGTIPSFSEIGLNTGSAYQPKTATYTPHGDGHPALTDVVVRRAIRMAINSQELADKVFLGYALPGTTIIPPVSVKGARWEPTGDDLINWDIAGANKLLEDAGYKDTDGDGVRETPPGSLDPGRPLEFRYFVRTDEQSSVDAAPFVAKWLEQIGIKADVESMSSGRLGDIINEGNYDLFSWGWIPDPDPDSALSWFLCSSRPPDGKTYGNNDSYYCNPEYDKLYDQQRIELDPTKRFEIVHQMQKIYYEDAAYSVMWYDPILQAYRSDRFTGYRPQPAPKGDLLEGYGGPSAVWTTLRPIGSGGGTETRGISPVIYLLIVGVLLVLGAVFWRRRNKPDEDEA